MPVERRQRCRLRCLVDYFMPSYTYPTHAVLQLLLYHCVRKPLAFQKALESISLQQPLRSTQAEATSLMAWLRGMLREPVKSSEPCHQSSGFRLLNRLKLSYLPGFSTTIAFHSSHILSLTAIAALHPALITPVSSSWGTAFFASFSTA